MYRKGVMVRPAVTLILALALAGTELARAGCKDWLRSEPWRQIELKTAAEQSKTARKKLAEAKLVAADDFGVSPTGAIKRARRRFEVRFAESAKLGAVDVFGFPYRQDGVWTIDVRLAKRFDQTEVARPSAALVGIPLSKLLAATNEEFFAYQVSPGSVGLFSVPGSPYLKIGEVLEVLPDSVVVADRGRRRTIPRLEFFAHNAFLKSGERQAVERLEKAGGEGRALLVDDHSMGDFAYGGLYLLLLKLPPKQAAVAQAVFADDLVYDQVESLLERKIRVFQTAGGKGYQGLYTGPTHSIPRSLPRPRAGDHAGAIVLSAEAGCSTVAHELKHFEDEASSALDAFAEKLYPLESKTVAFEELVPLYHLVREQRGYARQFEYLESLLASGRKTIPVNDGWRTIETDLATFVVAQKQSGTRMFRKLYVDPAAKLLDSGRIPAPLRRAAIDAIRKALHPSKELEWSSFGIRD